MMTCSSGNSTGTTAGICASSMSLAMRARHRSAPCTVRRASPRVHGMSVVSAGHFTAKRASPCSPHASVVFAADAQRSSRESGE